MRSIHVSQLLLLLAFVGRAAVGRSSEDDLTLEVQRFWQRLLAADPYYSLAPTPPPIDESNVPCDVRVELDCKLRSSGRPCNSITPPDNPSDSTCLEVLCYEIDMINIGSVELDVTQVELAINSEVFSLLDRVTLGTLQAGQSTQVEAKFQVDVCQAGEYNAEVNVAAVPPNGDMCQAEDQYQSSVPSLPMSSSTPLARAQSNVPPTPEIACEVEVVLDCTLSDGRPCDAAEAPESTACDIQEAINMITLSYQQTACNSGGNSQGDQAPCLDLSPIMFFDPVSIDCVGSDGQHLLVEPDSVVPGGRFGVSGNEGTNLPAKIRCTIADADGTLLQLVTIDTSGFVRLDLTDDFGSLRLEGCIRGGEELNCYALFGYEIDLSNAGTVQMTVDTFDFSFNGMVFDLLGEIGANPLSPGETTTLEPNIEANLCSAQDYIAAIDVQAVIPNGDRCQVDDDNYVIQVSPLPSRPPPSPSIAPSPGRNPQPMPGPTGSPMQAPTPPPPTPTPPQLPQTCDVNIIMDCKTLDGQNCSENMPPAGSTCADGSNGINLLEFSYQNRDCAESVNSQGGEAQCTDEAPLVAEPVEIQCFTVDASTLTIEPEIVSPGSSFTVSVRDGGPLPQKINCGILSGGGLLQSNIIDTSGTVQLDVGDKFGALRVESCGDKTCKEVLSYGIEIQNVGDVPLAVTAVVFELNGTPVSLIGDVQPDPLNPGQSISFEPKVEINTCASLEYSGEVTVEAESPDGDMCQDSEEISFNII